MSGRRLRVMVMVLAVLAAVAGAAGPAGAAAIKPAEPPVMEDYCIIPPFIGKTAPPLIMMLLQKDHKLFRKAYDDYSDIDNDGYREITYEHNTNNFYYGYFDPIKCYTYDSANNRFSPSRISNLDWLGRPNGRCGGVDEWSGNFLNWATMTRLDVMRKVFYGGYRFSQNASVSEPHVVLERAFLPQDGHSFVKRFWGDVTDFTPYGTQSATPLNSLVLCNTTNDPTSKLPLMRVATTDGTDWFEEDRWSAHERWQCAYRGELISEGATVPINGSFDLNTTGWTASNLTAAVVPGGVSGNALELTESAITNTAGYFFINAPTAVGQHYRFSMYAKRGTADWANTYLYSPSPYDWYDSIYAWDSVWTRYEVTFQATQAQTRIQIYLQDYDGIASETFYFDEFELLELNEDRTLALASEGQRPDPLPYNAADPADRGNKVDDFTVRVEACLSTLLGSENCFQYEQFGNFMPGGLFQKYGQDKSMYFSLITGSFNLNKSGGRLRNKMEDIGSSTSAAINRATGVFTSVGTGGGVLQTLNEMDIANYSYSTGTYDGDNCASGLSDFLDENDVAGKTQCSNWGNPMGEIFYEGLRFFSGKTGATASYSSEANQPESISLPTETWISDVDPYNEPYVEECNKAFNLIISDEFPSYDSDQIPGASFATDSGSFYSTSAADLSLDVTDLTNQVAQMEGIYNGATYFVGDNGIDSDGICNPKSVTNLGQVRGLCPGEGGQKGSYSMAGLAYYGKTTDVRPDTASAPVGKVGDQDVTTYAISLGKGMPDLNMTVNGQQVSIIPSCYNYKTGKPCTFVDMRIWWQWQYGGGVVINWDEDQQGGDYDMDVMQYLNWEAWDSDGDTVYDSVRVYTDRWWLPDGYVTTDTITLGYAITGVAEAGTYHDVIVNTDPAKDLWSYDPVTFERIDVPDGVTDTCGDGMYDWEWPLGDCRSERYFTPGASTAQLLKSPLWLAAKYGGFEDIDDDGTPNLNTEWDINSDGRPDTYFDASNIGKLDEQLEAAFSAILRRVTSGTAASVLASGEGSGANLVQAVYYPRRRFATREVKWLGSLQNLWYYVDPYFQNSTIREDTNKDGILDLAEDLIVHMFYDPTAGSTSAYLYEDNDGSGGPDPNYDSDGDGVDDTALAVDVKEFAAMNTLWQAGNKLWARDAGTRAIYFYNGVTPIPYPLPLFNTGKTAALAPLMGLAGQTDKTSDVIKFTQGYELVFVDRDGDGDHDYRRRTADVDLNGDGDTLDAGEKNEWKLGDIIDSTPRISTHLPLHFYDKTYGDDTYRYSDTYGYLNTDVYDRHGLVFTGANDGMLHAFRMGDLQMSDDPDWVVPPPSGHDIARLAGTDLGREEWAFIPMNVLPYLQYIAQDDYCHLISVDLSPYVFDASINRDPVDKDGNLQPGYCTDSNYWNCKKTENSWRTIVIGGLRFGGACRNRDYGCDGEDCTNVPVRTTVDGVADTDVGYSVYFALDVTHQYDALGNPQAPRLLWEFAHDELGVSSTGPAIVRINGWEDTDGDGIQDAGENEDNTGVTQNGRWLVVIGSGPTGPISPNDHQFLGKSDQNLKFFVLDLKSGQLLTTDGLGSPTPIDTGVPYAFAGSMINVTHDVSLDNYEDEILYVGYTYTDDSNPTSTSSWDNGGVGRIVTNGSADPNDWVWSALIDDVGPVTAAPAKLENTRSRRIWVFFGAGRFFYKQLDVVDDMANPRSIYGVVDQCFSGGHYVAACTNADPADDSTVQTLKTSLNNATDVNNASNDPDGWYIDMDAAVDTDGDNKLDIGAERVISDVVATTTGLVFYTTFTPYVSACTLGGKSYIWATDYATGGDPGARLLGKGLVQVSTGAIEEVDLKTAFDEKGGRRTGAMEGVPPTGGALNLQAPPEPEKRVIHVLEK